MVLGAAAFVAAMVRPAVTAEAPGVFGSAPWTSATHERFGQTDVYVLEDRKSVYVAFSASDADSDDAVTLYLWSDKAAYAFTVNAQGKRSAWCSVAASALPAWSAQEQHGKSGYTVTMQLPRALFSGSQSHWLTQFARALPQRHLAYTWPQSEGGMGDVRFSAAFDPGSNEGAFTAVSPVASEPKVTAAGDKGIALTETRHSIALTARAEQNPDGTQENAASLDWTSPDQRLTAGVQRSANADRTQTNISQAVSVGYDNQQNVRFSAGLAAQGGTNVSDSSLATSDYYDFSLYGKNSTLDMRWNAAGPQYDPSDGNAPAAGTSGYTLSLSQQLGNVLLSTDANRYHDDLGNLFEANESAAIQAALSPALTFDVNAAQNAATPYTSAPFSQDSAGLRYSKDGRRVSFAFEQQQFQNGSARAALSGGFTLPAFGRRSNFSLGYQNAGGNANVTFSFDDRLPIGLLRATYENAGTMFSAPTFSIKLVRL